MNEKTFSQMQDGEIWTDLAFAIAEADMEKRKCPPGGKLLDCCRAMRMLKERGMKAMYYFHGTRKFEVVKVNFCPECGRRL